MNRKSLRQLLVFSHQYRFANVLLVMFLVCFFGWDASAQSPSRGAGEIQTAEVGGVKFVVPAGFQLEPSESDKLSFMRNRSEPLALFVTIAEHHVNDKYLSDLSSNLVTRLRRAENSFRWKLLGSLDSRLSRYQTNRGIIKGIMGKTFVQVDYVVVKVQDQDIVIGSIAQFGEERTATFLFDAEGREYSVPGWQALFQLIPSVTGEKGK
jgi:hypothetical protein